MRIDPNTGEDILRDNPEKRPTTGISIGIISMCISQLVVIIEEYGQFRSLRITRENNR